MTPPRQAEIRARSLDGHPMLAVGAVLIGAALYGAAALDGRAATPSMIVLLSVLAMLGALAWAGVYVLHPNQAAVLQLFGAYRGTDHATGLRWANPLYRKTRISLRAHNLNTDKIKVNDQRGNPIEIGAAVVWRVQDTALASFEIESYHEYVRVQSDAAVRHLASSYPYDEAEDCTESAAPSTLRGSVQEVSASLTRELSERLQRAGIVVEEAKLTHLAYAPEIAGVMLRRQQAEAMIAARQKIVAGAVSMVEMALARLAERGVIALDDEHKAAMVSNLLVVLCAERDTQPVVNTGAVCA